MRSPKILLKMHILGRSKREWGYGVLIPQMLWIWLQIVCPQGQLMAVSQELQRVIDGVDLTTPANRSCLLKLNVLEFNYTGKPRYNFKQWIALTFHFFHVPRSMDESFNLSDDSSGPSPGIVRKKKIAIGVIFSLSRDEDENSKFNEFFFSHFPLFESHMNKLKSAIEQVNTASSDSFACIAVCSPSALSDFISNSCLQKWDQLAAWYWSCISKVLCSTTSLMFPIAC